MEIVPLEGGPHQPFCPPTSPLDCLSPGSWKGKVVQVSSDQEIYVKILLGNSNLGCLGGGFHKGIILKGNIEHGKSKTLSEKKMVSPLGMSSMAARTCKDKGPFEKLRDL